MAAEALRRYTNLHVLKSNPQVKAIQTIIRDQNTTRNEFVFHSNRLIRLLIEEGLSHLPFEERIVTTPTGESYKGTAPAAHICGVSIIRAGESMEAGLREVCQNCRIGKILIQRDEETALPKLFYSKLPADIASRHILLLDPMLATGGSAIKAIEVLIEAGVKEEHIIFLNLIAAPEGIDAVFSAHPRITLVTGEIDTHLSDRKYIIPVRHAPSDPPAIP